MIVGCMLTHDATATDTVRASRSFGLGTIRRRDKALETGKGALEVDTWPRVLLPSFLHPQPTSMQPFECKRGHPSNGIVYCPTLMSEDFVRCFHVKPLN